MIQDRPHERVETPRDTCTLIEAFVAKLEKVMIGGRVKYPLWASTIIWALLILSGMQQQFMVSKDLIACGFNDSSLLILSADIQLGRTLFW